MEVCGFCLGVRYAPRGRYTPLVGMTGGEIHSTAPDGFARYNDKNEKEPKGSFLLCLDKKNFYSLDFYRYFCYNNHIQAF